MKNFCISSLCFNKKIFFFSFFSFSFFFSILKYAMQFKLARISRIFVSQKLVKYKKKFKKKNFCQFFEFFSKRSISHDKKIKKGIKTIFLWHFIHAQLSPKKIFIYIKIHIWIFNFSFCFFCRGNFKKKGVNFKLKIF